MLCCLGAGGASAETEVSICYGYGCIAQAQVHYSDAQLRAVDKMLIVAVDPAEERKMLADAIGPLWSRMPEMRPLLGWLHDEVVAGRLRVGGIDPQVGGRTGRYAKARLGTALASVLAEPRRTDCAQEFDRHDGWL